MCIDIIIVHKNSNKVHKFPSTGSNSNIPITLKTVKPPSPSTIEKHYRQLKVGPGGRQGEMKMLDDYTEDAILLHQKGLIAVGRTDECRACFAPGHRADVCGNAKR